MSTRNRSTLEPMVAFGAGWPVAIARALALVVLASSVVPELQAQQPGDRVLGARVRVLQHQAAEVRGELLALGDQRLWIRNAADHVVDVPFTGIREVRIQRHGWSTSRIARWTLIAGGGTSLAMFGACMSVEGNSAGDCGGFTLAWAGAWAGVGVLSRALVRPTLSVRPARIEEARAYARFPQGLPDGYPPSGAELTTEPEAP